MIETLNEENSKEEFKGFIQEIYNAGFERAISQALRFVGLFRLSLGPNTSDSDQEVADFALSEMKARTLEFLSGLKSCEDGLIKIIGGIESDWMNAQDPTSSSSKTTTEN